MKATESEVWTSTAFHEAGHAVVARTLKIPLGEIVVYEDCSGGYTYCEPTDHSYDDRAALYVAGAVSEAQHARRGHEWREFLTDGDAALLASVTPKANANFFEEWAAVMARSILWGRWGEVEQIVGLLRKHNGSLELFGVGTIPTWRLSRMPGTHAYERRQLESAADGDGDQWITIGGHRGADGKKHGGTPVKIKGGKIVSGPKALRGKSIKRLASGNPNHHVEYRRAVNKAHTEHGFSKSDIADAIEFVHGERKRLHDEREAAKEQARKLTGLTAGDISRLANAGRDYASGAKAGGVTGEKLRHFDQFAQEAAREHPELGLGDPDSGDNFASRLWDVLGEGKQEAPAKHHEDTVNEAIQLLYQNARYQSVNDEVPF